MAKFSRMKGRRAEQELVLALAKLGYKAERILRQYQFAGQPDVKATKGDKTYTFEMKARRGSFTSLYNLYYSQRAESGLFCVAEKVNGAIFAMSTDFESLLTATDARLALSILGLSGREKLTLARIFRLTALKQSADFLVLKDNNKARLYVRYWNGI